MVENAKVNDYENGSVIVYGAGNYLLNHYKYLFERYLIEAIVDKNKLGQFEDVPIYGLEYLKGRTSQKIIIMIENRDVCMSVANMLNSEYGIPRANIVLGVNMLNSCDDRNSFKVGIMGCGSIASQMAHTIIHLRSDIEVYACASRSQGKADDFAFKFGIKKSYGSYADMLDDAELDMIYIATPISEHYPNMMMCIDKGKDVLCEKAFTVNTMQAKEILKMAGEKGVFVAEAMSICYHPLYAFLRKCLDEQVIGKIINVTVNFSYRVKDIERIRNPYLAGGALLDLGVYPINFMFFCLGYDCRNLNIFSNMSAEGVDETMTITAQYDYGQTAMLFFDINSFGNNQGVITGDSGYIVVENIHRPTRISIYDRNRNLLEERRAISEDTGLENEIVLVKNAIRQKELEVRECSHAHTVKTMEMMDGIREKIGFRYPFE